MKNKQLSKASRIGLLESDPLRDYELKGFYSHVERTKVIAPSGKTPIWLHILVVLVCLVNNVDGL